MKAWTGRRIHNVTDCTCAFDRLDRVNLKVEEFTVYMDYYKTFDGVDSRAKSLLGPEVLCLIRGLG